MVRLGSSSKPATVSIGGSSGKTTTTPAKSSSSTASTAQKLSSLEKTLAPATQATASAPAPKPSIKEFVRSTVSQPSTPVKPVVATPTPAQAIQQSIASGTNVPISAQTLAARNQGLKALKRTRLNSKPETISN